MRKLSAVMALAMVATLYANSIAEQPARSIWRYTTTRPAEGWQKAGFDDSQWETGAAGFGQRDTPGARVQTEWKTNDIWLRRTFDLKQIPQRPALLIHHDEDTEVYINGQLAARFEKFTTYYRVALLDAAGKKKLVEGENQLAVHCHQTGGGQYIDLHLIDADAIPELNSLLGSASSVQSKIMTRWGEKVSSENAWQEYPRPQMVRKNWTNLNGPWDYAVASLDSGPPRKWAGKILVPYCLESKLSGVGRLLEPFESLWYHREVELAPRTGRRTLLRFEAVDYRCRLWVNGKEVGEHVGGNDPFAFDISNAIRKGANELLLRVEDATGGAQLRGKQSLAPSGIWYTRVSGIWQTVWLEEVGERHIDHLKISTDIETGTITVKAQLQGEPRKGEQLYAAVYDQGKKLAEATDSLNLQIENPKLWSPASPHLYDLQIELRGEDGQVIDRVESYAGLRKVGQTRDRDGHLRFTLNNEPIFHWGPLDQGWWPDGLLTPPSDEAMRYDVDFLKEAGFNMIRKHIKVEPRRYYYHCDRAGMLVWQDQVAGGANPAWTRLQPEPHDAYWEDADHEQFMRELSVMMDTLDHFPCIVVWTPFNEAWGQHRTLEVGRWVVKRDPTRLVNIASGGNFWPVGHVADEHSYPHPAFPLGDARFDDYIKVVGEFGGHGWPVKGHLWDDKRENWGYGGLPKSLDEYNQRYRKSIDILLDLKAKGIAAGVYTQTTDVEGEINGLLTYDRSVSKIPAKELRELHAPLIGK